MISQGTRIKQIRQYIGYSQEEFGKLFNATRSYISLVEGDKSKLSVENLVKLSLTKNVNLNFLLTGKGEMFINTCENTHALIKNKTIEASFKCWGNRLNKILAENNETPLQFSKRTGIKESRIEDFILYSKEPTISELNAIKSNVDVSMDELLYGQTIENTQTNEASLSVQEVLQLKQLLKNSKV